MASLCCEASGVDQWTLADYQHTERVAKIHGKLAFERSVPQGTLIRIAVAGRDSYL